MDITQDDDERAEELNTLMSIYPEMIRDGQDPFSVTLDVDVELDQPINLKFVNMDGNAADERGAVLKYVPLLMMRIRLPAGYPSEKPPEVSITAEPEWLPREKLVALENMASEIWDSWGRMQILFTYLDSLKDEAQYGFGLIDPKSQAILLDSSRYLDIMEYQAHAQKTRFNQQVFDCEVCLSAKRGTDCYKMSRCGHVFCKKCLRDFYTVHITEGDVYKVQCPGYNCYIKTPDGKKVFPLVPPAELLQIPLDRKLVQRYADMKRKKKMDADQSTIYCPRDWCQAPARSKKFPKLGDISEMTELEDPEVVEEQPLPVKQDGNTEDSHSDDDRLAICESCTYAFCKVCKKTWHGEYFRCEPRDPNELSAEELANLEYIRKYTTECPTCITPVQKQAGCNHMTCLQCRTHFCYLCSSWLNAHDPYRHYNTVGNQCYQRLFDMGDGDHGDGAVQFVGARQWEMDALVEAVEALIDDE